MCAVRSPREDYAPSRIAYRVNRLWLSPVFRVATLWLLPMAVIGGGAGLWASQPGSQELIQNVRMAVMARMRDQPDFQVKQMAVRGASPELTREIRRVLALEFPVSVIDLDLDAIRVKVSAFDAVQHVEAHIVLGGALMLDVTQRAPAVIWRNAGGLALLDEEGHRVALAERRDAAPELPLIAAAGAERAIPEALAIVAAAAPLRDRMRGLVRQGERRWDVALTGGQVIQLPETGAVEALERVLAMDEAGDLLGRDIRIIDMRNPARPTIRLGDEAFAYLKTLRGLEKG
ncbi:cell division protein FtsQ/DivIB [Mangrovicoccus algicola]|uniref:Cell division protein FtsQ n=1 Tax=Mangrovicoccus algicola TaxID=2771008 RepID=A0A8J6YSS4_9RHOB|nr:cell division protein FtsQ/DivIB [Mangrovicoccus algicola]MBE3637112.1 cell division protein FtsQ/DivIB [Mangrovicoccus algicola]